MASQLLHDDIVEKITTFLPVKIAARTTLLSRKFTRSWTQNRDLCFIQPEGYQNVERIHNVMVQHAGPKIDRFVLKLNAAGHEHRILEWVRMAVAKGVEELDLDLIEPTVLISSDLLNSELSSIRILKLASCNLNFSGQQIHGFRFIKTLGFRNATVTPPLMRSVLRNCLALENLEIRDCLFEPPQLNIYAGLLDHFKTLTIEHHQELSTLFIYSPTLEEFSYSGEICSILFENPVPTRLNSVAISFLTATTRYYVPRAAKLAKAIGGCCTKLQICAKFMQGIILDHTGMNPKLSVVRDLTLFLNGANNVRRGISIIDPYDIVCFLCDNGRSLEKLHMEFGEYPFGEDEFWRLKGKELFEKCQPPCPSLKRVIIKGFKYRKLEVQLLKMIVEHAPLLSNVALVLCVANRDSSPDESFLEWMRAQLCSFVVNLPM